VTRRRVVGDTVRFRALLQSALHLLSSNRPEKPHYLSSINASSVEINLQQTLLWLANPQHLANKDILMIAIC
jgi:hypothetical protein